MKKLFLVLIVASAAIFTGCDTANKDKTKEPGTEQEPGIETPGEEVEPEIEIPVPDNKVAKRIISKYNQGPAVNNSDYADALQYVESYHALTAESYQALSEAETDNDKEAYAAAENSIREFDEKYPYNARLKQILYQAAELDETRDGLVPMNDDIRARFDAFRLSE